MRVTGKTLVVTGGGYGIGREVVLGLLARGARVAIADLSEEGMQETARLAATSEETLTLHRVDVSDRDAVHALPDEVRAAHGQVDGVVHDAGIIQPFVRVADLDYADIDRLVGVNLWGTIHVAKAFIPMLRQRPAACLVNVSSMGAFVAVPGQAVYCASKAATAMLSEAMYAELRGTSVAVTAVYPGAVDTDIAAHSHVQVPQQRSGSADADDSTTGSLTRPEDAAKQIIDGIEEGAFRVVIGRDAKALDGLSRLNRRRATEMVAKRMGSLLGG